MKVIIEKTGDGQFLVSMSHGEDESQPGQPAASIEEALKMAGKLLSMPMEGEENMFDEGMRRTAPMPAGMGGY
mgnify:CR=1 FL=1